MPEELKQVREALEFYSSPHVMQADKFDSDGTTGINASRRYPGYKAEKAISILDTLIAGQAWQPIDTAPKEGVKECFVGAFDKRAGGFFYNLSEIKPRRRGEDHIPIISSWPVAIRGTHYFIPQIPPPPQSTSEGR